MPLSRASSGPTARAASVVLGHCASRDGPHRRADSHRSPPHTHLLVLRKPAHGAVYLFTAEPATPHPGCGWFASSHGPAHCRWGWWRAGGPGAGGPRRRRTVCGSALACYHRLRGFVQAGVGALGDRDWLAVHGARGAQVSQGTRGVGSGAKGETSYAITARFAKPGWCRRSTTRYRHRAMAMSSQPSRDGGAPHLAPTCNPRRDARMVRLLTQSRETCSAQRCVHGEPATLWG